MRLLLMVGFVVVLFAGVGAGGVMVYSKIRGIRNNNPLNIEKGDDWQGLAPVQSDLRFCVFTDAVYGIRAGARILANYSKRGVNTLEKIVSTWAPKNENDTEAYIKNVVKWTGFKRDRVITKNSGDYVPLIAAMIRQENGINPYSTETIAKGVALA